MIEVHLNWMQQVKAVAEEMGIGFLGIGFQPKWGIKDIPIMPKVIWYDGLVLGLLKCIAVISVSFYISDANYLNEPSLHGPHA